MNKQQIIYVDNKPHIKCGVVMLSSDKKSDLRVVRGYDGNPLCYDLLMDSVQLHNNRNSTISYQHLYFTSDEEIKEGDWSYNDILKEIVQNNCSSNRLVSINANEHNHKVIATTDTSLTLKGEQEGENAWYNPLPQLSQQFIEEYIEEYNKRHQITEVLVEVEEIKHYSGSVDSLDVDDDYDYIEYKLKLDSQNQITIRKQKDSWSREEVNELCKSAYVLGANNQQIFIDNSSSEIKRKETPFNEWIEENL